MQICQGTIKQCRQQSGQQSRNRKIAQIDLRNLTIAALFMLVICGVAFAQDDNPFRELDRTLDWDHFGSRSRSRFASQVFGEDALEKLDSKSIPLFRRSRLGSVDNVPESSPLTEQNRRPTIAAVPSANVPLQADVADPSSPPIRRPTGFFQRPGVLEPNGLLGEPATPREQRWFREPGGPREGAGIGVPEAGIGRGAVAIGGEEALRSAPNAQTGTIRTPTPTPLNSEQTRRKFEEKLEGLLLSDPNVHLLSPVQVSFNGGVATVRGVVPNQSHKIAVGSILLSDPAVRQVNNMISIVPLDPSKNPPPIER